MKIPPLCYPRFFLNSLRLTLIISAIFSQGLWLFPAREVFAAPDEAPLLAGDAAISINGLGRAPIGANVSFSVSFDNVGADAGYGPFIDVILDTTGADGVYPGDTPANQYDGLGTSSIAASYLGAAIPAQESARRLRRDI